MIVIDFERPWHSRAMLFGVLTLMQWRAFITDDRPVNSRAQIFVRHLFRPHKEFRPVTVALAPTHQTYTSLWNARNISKMARFSRRINFRLIICGGL